VGELRTVLLEGIFYEEGDDFLVQMDSQPQPMSVREALTPMIDQDVHLAAHHFPATPLDKNRWGGGCCMWESAGKCPAGHHKDPAYLFNAMLDGVLRYDPLKGWAVGEKAIDLRLLAGHRSRIVAVIKFNLDKMRESLGSLDPNDLSELGGRATQMRDVLAQLQDFLREMKDD